MNTITSGNDLRIPIQLNVNEYPYSIDPESVVKAAFVDPVNLETVTVVKELDINAPGANWEKGLIIFELSSQESEPLGEYVNKKIEIEIEVNSPSDGIKTWRVGGFAVQKGIID